MTKTKITVTCLNGYTFSLTLINTSVDNMKKEYMNTLRKLNQGNRPECGIILQRVQLLENKHYINIHQCSKNYC